MASILDDLKYAYHSGNIVTRFVLLNVAVFAAITLIGLAGFFFKTDLVNKVLPWIAGHTDALTMLYRPWTAITYMFVHEGLWHLVFNMILLWFAGRLFADLLNEKRFIAVYFMGGLAGFLLYFAAFNIFPVFAESKSTIIGASASVMALLVAIATYHPNMELRLILIGIVKLKYIAIFFVVLDVLFLDKGNTGGRLAHIGGAAFGYFYSNSLKQGNDWSRYFFGFTGFFRDLFVPKPKLKVASKKPQGTNTAYATSRSNESGQQKKIDMILDKISRSGYDSLTKEEKEFLFNASKK
jgi:membrane associated rhomboid family serine protease